MRSLRQRSALSLLFRALISRLLEGAELTQIITCSNINQVLADAGKYHGFEKFAVPLLRAGLSR